MSSQQLNDPALPWDQLTFIQGGPITPSSAFHNNIVVLEQWATWCPPCRQSIPHLNSLQQRFHKQGVRIVGVTEETDRGKLTKFIHSMGSSFSYPVAIDTQGAMAEWGEKYGVRGIPHAFIIDWEGRVRWSGHPMAGLDDKLDVLVNEFKAWQAKQSHGAAPSAEAAKRLRAMSVAELQAKSVSELMRLMKDAVIDSSNCIEKSDLIDRIRNKTAI